MWINFKFWLIPRYIFIISLDILCRYTGNMQFNGVNNKEDHAGNDPYMYIAKSRPRKNQSECSDLPQDHLTI